MVGFLVKSVPEGHGIYWLVPVILCRFLNFGALHGAANLEEHALIMATRAAVREEVSSSGGRVDDDQALTRVMARMLSSENESERIYASDHILSCPTYFVYLAAAHGHTKIAQLVAENNPSALAIGNEWGTTPAHLAAEAGQLAIAQIIVRYHPNAMQTKDLNGATPAHYAARNGHLKILAVIAEIEPSGMQAQDLFGRTPLHFAAQRGNLPAVKFLTHHFPHLLKIRDQWGEVPAESAYAKRYNHVVNFLIRSPVFRKTYLGVCVDGPMTFQRVE